MKTEKELQLFKTKLMNTLESVDNVYYGLSLENLVQNN